MIKQYQFPFKAMGSPCEIKLYCKDEQTAQNIANLVVSDVLNIEQRYSRYRQDSVLSQINRVAEKGGRIDIDEETVALLNYADTCYKQSGGLFDISSGVLRKIWDFKEKKIPTQAAIKEVLKRVGWQKIELTGSAVNFTVSNMELDFGGIGKEYAVDRAATICWEHGVRSGFVNLGGDIKVIGPHPDGSPWMVGVSHPRKQDELLMRLPVYSGAVASSGDYERCIEVNGRRYGHVLNPKTGWPVQGLAAVTVIADQCVVAGSACTISMLKDKKGKKWIKNVGLDYLWVDQNGRVGGSLAG